MKTIPSAALCAALSALWLGGCATYKPAPFEPERHAQAWDGRAKEAGQDADAALSPAGAERLALLFNPELRLARAEAGVQAAGSSFAGLLEDPSFGMGAVGAGLGRRISGGPSPWILEGGLSVTLPLSDRLQVEKKNAKHALTAAEAQVAAQEAQVVREVRMAFARFAGTQARVQAWEGHQLRLEALGKRLAALVEAGSVPVYEADAAAFSLTEAKANAVEAKVQRDAERLRILALCGLRPTCPVRLSPTGSAGAAAAEHPALVAAKADFEVAESALQLEVTRSRPELSLGPTASRADGETTLGIGLGLTLPVWNRNQKAIAQASARREGARILLEKTIESLAHGAAEAKVRSDGAAARLDIIRRDMQPLLERQTATVDRLVQLGEFDPLRLMAVLDRRVQWELSLAGAQADLEETRAEASYFTHPLSSLSKLPKDAAKAEVKP